MKLLRMKQRALQALVVQRLMDVVLEAGRRHGDGHRLAPVAASPIGGSFVMPASTSAT